MVIPDREILRTLLARLQPVPWDEADLPGYGRAVLQVTSGLPAELVSTAFIFFKVASVESIEEFHGHPCPERGQLIILRFHITSLMDAVQREMLKLPEPELDKLRVLFNEDDPYAAVSGTRERVTKPVSRLSGTVPMPPSRHERASMESYDRRPILSASTSSTAVPAAPPEHQEYDVLGRPVVRHELRHYLFAGIMLGIAALLTMEALELRWPQWLKVTISAGIPIVFFVAYFISRTLKVIRHLRFLLIWGSVAVVTAAAGNFAYQFWRQVTTLNRLDTARQRLDVLTSALDRYRESEGIYPRSLDVLFQSPNYLDRSPIRTAHDLQDPFDRGGATLSYQRSLDSFLLRSRGPDGRLAELPWPATPSTTFRKEVAQASYDPTNGTFSTGDLITLGRALRQLEPVPASGTPALPPALHLDGDEASP